MKSTKSSVPIFDLSADDSDDDDDGDNAGASTTTARRKVDDDYPSGGDDNDDDDDDEHEQEHHDEERSSASEEEEISDEDDDDDDDDDFDGEENGHPNSHSPVRAKSKRGPVSRGSRTTTTTTHSAVAISAASKKRRTSDSHSAVATSASTKKSTTKMRENKEEGSDNAKSTPPPTKTIEQTYQKKSQLDHILLRPDTYIGSIEPITQLSFVHDANTGRIIQRDITYTPGFYKMYDEIIVNAADNKQRDPHGMDRLDVTVNVKQGTICVMNNGKGIPVVMHKEHNCFVPTLIFGHLLTGSNFDDDEKKTTGGRNGYGAKLANIFSTKFVVECLDSQRGVKFTQVWRDNMRTAEKPTVVNVTSATERKKGDYTKITFRPDFDKLNMPNGLDDDVLGLISKRAYDIAGSMSTSRGGESGSGGKKLNVYLNGDKIKVTDFRSYLSLFDGIPTPAVYEKVSDKWEVGVGPILDGTGFQQISFVNAISTTKGGGHVDYITNTLVKHLQSAVNKKNKGGKDVKPAQVKSHLCVFVNCLVENPTFDSQTKENLTTKSSTFKKDVILSDAFLKKVEKCGVVESITQLAKFQEGRALQRKGGTKKTKLTGITKLDDANHAGTAKSKDCTLIITEGDSAKSLAVSGLSVVGRDYYGVFPLKGKLLNVRDATHAQIMKNEEIMNLVEILGLKFKQTYTEENIKTLRYGHLMIMADQDHDGSHIKGLVINFLHHFWPSLLDVPGFLQMFITPIVKVSKGKESKTFFTLPEYEAWKESTENDAKGWTIKYYKGLGTSTSAEAKDYFSHLDIHEIHFNEISTDHVSSSSFKDNDDNMSEEDDDDDNNESDELIKTGSGLIEMAFSKSKVEDRKRWLARVKKDTFLDMRDAQENGCNYSDFINRELVLFSQYDNIRSIPHLLDGFKPSQRKVLFACFKKKLKTEIKVAQLAGYIGEHSAYHHGEQSLHGAIIGMAQTYCGSNNVNLLYPSGQFGTRRMGGKDHASARYIFTRLEKIARAIFHPDDDPLLNYLNDDGLSIEPEYYMPVIPMILVNGSEGIGTGWSCTIQNHNPREIIGNIRKMINGEEPTEMHPYFCGYSGEILANSGKKVGNYTVRGKIKRVNETSLLITELPIGKWTQDYKIFLEGMMAGSEKSPAEISDFKENHTDTTVSFTVNAPKEVIDSFEKDKDGLHGKFKLSTTISTKNMTAFDKLGNIRTFASNQDILLAFYRQRKVFYHARKGMLLHKKRADLSILDNKARFVVEVCSGELVVSNRKRSELLAELFERGYELSSKDEDETSEFESNEEDEEADMLDEDTQDAELAKGYEYLLGMKIWSLTFERAEQLRKQKAEKAAEVDLLEATTPEQIWLADLDAIEQLLDERDKALGFDEKRSSSKTKINTTVAKNKYAKRKLDEDEWNSNESEESDEESASDSDEEDEQSVASKIIKENKEATAESIAPAKVSIPIAKKAKTSSSTKTLATGNIKGKRASITKSKARTTSEGKLVVSLGVSPKFSYKSKKTSMDDSDDSVVKHGGFDDDFLVDSDDDSITGMTTSNMKLGQVSKNNLKRKHDPDSNEFDSFGKKSRGRGVAKSTQMALELLDSDDDRHGKSESDSNIECY